MEYQLDGHMFARASAAKLDNLDVKQKRILYGLLATCSGRLRCTLSFSALFGRMRNILAGCGSAAFNHFPSSQAPPLLSYLLMHKL